MIILILLGEQLNVLVWSWKTRNGHGKGHGKSWNFKSFEYKPGKKIKSTRSQNWLRVTFFVCKRNLKESLRYSLKICDYLAWAFAYLLKRKLTSYWIISKTSVFTHLYTCR